MTKSLEELIAEVLRVPRAEITDDSGPNTHPSWHSVRHIDLITALEAAYGIEFSINEIIAMDKVASIRAQLKNKGIAV